MTRAGARFAVLNPATWLGSGFDWAFSALAVLLIAAGYYDAWINRNLPVHPWEHGPAQAAWLLITIFLAIAGLSRWLRDRRVEAIVPSGYGISVIGSGVFGLGILLGVWWGIAVPEVAGVPAVFRPPNLLQIAGAGLIVTGPLRSAIARGELLAGPTAVISATLLLATITFVSQFDHPYVDTWAGGLSCCVTHVPPIVLYHWIGEELGLLGLFLQTAIVTGTVLLTLRQIRLPLGAITFMLTATALLVCTQLGHFQFVAVAAIVGVLSDALLLWARPRSDRLVQLRAFAAATGALLAGVYLADLELSYATYWPADLVFGSILACGVIGWLMTYMIFPEREVARAAAVLWPPLDQDSIPSAPDITTERLEHALKVLHSPRDLGESPLIWMRCLPTHNSLALKQVIEDAIGSIRASTSQVDAQAGEILNLYYVRRIGGHYAVELRVGLSRAAYFNRRSYGVRRLVDRLKELEEQAATA